MFAIFAALILEGVVTAELLAPALLPLVLVVALLAVARAAKEK